MRYSKKEEESNPVIRDFTDAFRNYKRKARLKPMKANFVDYIIFFSIVVLLIIFSLFAGKGIRNCSALIIATAFLFEIISTAIH